MPKGFKMKQKNAHNLWTKDVKKMPKTHRSIIKHIIKKVPKLQKHMISEERQQICNRRDRAHPTASGGPESGWARVPFKNKSGKT